MTRAKKDADQTLEAQYDRLQLLDRNYVNTRHHHANYTNTTLAYLYSLESRMADMRSDIARAKQTQESCEAEVIAPLSNALHTVRALFQDAMHQFAAESQLHADELMQVKSYVVIMQQNYQARPQQQQQQIQQQIQQQKQQELEHLIEEREELVVEQLEQINELKHEIRLLQLQHQEQQLIIEEHQKKEKQNKQLDQQEEIQHERRDCKPTDVYQVFILSLVLPFFFCTFPLSSFSSFVLFLFPIFLTFSFVSVVQPTRQNAGTC
jgi:thiol:disulfide interchange protein